MSFITTILTFLGLAAGQAFTNVGVDEFAKLIAQPGVTILDVRTQAEFAEGHIAGAINVDVNSPDFTKQVAKLKLAKGASIAVYCRSGRRSANACAILAKAGYTRLTNLSTGILGWTAAGKPTTK